jgi:hypothetical protein
MINQNFWQILENIPNLLGKVFVGGEYEMFAHDKMMEHQIVSWYFRANFKLYYF